MAKIDIQQIEKWMREYGDLSDKTYVAIDASDVVRNIKQKEAIIQDLRSYLQAMNDNQGIMLKKIRQHELLVEEFKDFLEENSIQFLSEKNFTAWLIGFIYPWLGQCIGKLVYDMNNLGKAIVKLEKMKD